MQLRSIYDDDWTAMRLGICTIVRDECRYLEEWIAFHLLMGVSEFRFYDNESRDDTQRILTTLASQVPISVVPWADRASWSATQRSAYLDGLEYLSTRCEFVAFIDIDEFLFTRSDLPLPDELALLPERVSAIAVNQRIFGSSGLLKSSSELVTSRFVRRAADDHQEHRWYKSIVKPSRVATFESSHNVRLLEGDYIHPDGKALVCSSEHPGCANHVSAGPIVLNHYILKSREEFVRKQLRWRGSSIETRYSNSYFDNRNDFANLVIDNLLGSYRKEILQRIGNFPKQSPTASSRNDHA